MENSNPTLVNVVIDKFIESRVHTVAPSTLRSDRSKSGKLKNHFKKRLIKDVNHSDIHDLIISFHYRYSNKSINEFLTILRAVFKRAQRDGAIERNPVDGIENLAVTNKEPKPLSKAEIKKLNDTTAECLNGKNVVLLNVLTGLRISELLALAWEDINWQRKELYVRRARVLNDYKTPKTTGSVRTVELNELAITLLKEQFELTGSKRMRTISVLQADSKTWIKDTVRFVFYNSKTNLPFLNAKQFNKTFFTPFLKKAEVQHRGVGQLRHTYASQNLTAGISKDWISRQMGHTGTNMIDKHYGRWMRSDAPDFANVAANHLADALGHSEAIPVEVSSEVPSDVLALVSALQERPELKALIQGVIGGAL
ncbi:tyrosine-type recombinase/integrase [Vibrio atlanticus]|uniref:tyrosine-type recombinase/integrase n=1 Tax=Vibrio atlanticus TaxID=693153 RepID=UPI00080FD27F|nr:tyrosine-type recombinase/integrase [Vibrio atlanticus]